MSNNFLKEIREIKRMSLSELGNLVGVSRQLLWGYETGKNNLSKFVLEKISEALGVSEKQITGAESIENIGDSLPIFHNIPSGSIRGTNQQASKNDKNTADITHALNPVLFRNTLEILDELTRGRNLTSEQKIELATGIYSKVEKYEMAKGDDKSKLLSQARISLMIDEGLVNFLSKKQHDEIQNLKIANESSAKKENCKYDGVATPRITAK